MECLRWIFEAQDQGLIKQVLGNGTQDLNFSLKLAQMYNRVLAPFDCYVLGYCIANSDCQWKLACRLDEEGMRMLFRASNDCLRNVQVIDFMISPTILNTTEFSLADTEEVTCIGN